MEDQTTLDYFQRRMVLNKHKASRLIDDLQDAVTDLRKRAAATPSRMEKNRLYMQIDNRLAQIQAAGKFL